MSGETLSMASLAALGSTSAAGLWLERLQRDNVGEDDALFRQWLDVSDENRRAWDRARDLWDLFDEEDELGVIEPMRQEALRLRESWSASSTVRYAVAASLALALSATLLIALPRYGARPDIQVAQARRPDLAQIGPSDYVTAVGQRRTISLKDGTRLTLDTDSAVDIAYSKNLRLVRLVRGQAFFDVTHDAAHPFRVSAGDRVVSDFGTKFNVRLSRNETRILLVAGSIGVSAGGDPRQPSTGPVSMLSPGQELIARPDRPDLIRTGNPEHGADWRLGFVQFDGDPLSAAVAELNRYSHDQLIIRDPTVAAMRVSGSFRTGDPARFARTVTALYPVRVVSAGPGKLEIVRLP